MIIDLVDVENNNQVMRFTSETVPRKGETISKIESKECWKVLKVDYLIRPVMESAASIGNDSLQLVTMVVYKINQAEDK